MSRVDARRGAPGLALATVVAAGGCQQKMRDQPRIEPLEASEFFADGMGAREVPGGAVPRGQARLDRHLWEGRLADGSVASSFPFPITGADLRRGEQRFAIYCVPCHGRLGEGDGMVVRRGYPAPPAYTIPRLLAAEPGDLFDVVTHGRAHMPDYDHIPVADRWRIVAWVRVLQFSRHAAVEALSAADHGARAEVLP